MAFQINGTQGKYDEVIADESTRYGRNAVENHLRYMEAPIVNEKNATPPPILDFAPTEEAQNSNMQAMTKYMDGNDAYLNSLPPLEYEYRYMPEKPVGQIDKKALLGAAYEEMGETEELPIKEFENRYLLDDTMTAKPIDINNDGKISNNEYATTILAADILSKGTDDVSKVDGVIKSKGMNAVLEYSKKSNAEAATKLYSNLYNTYQLGEN